MISKSTSNVPASLTWRVAPWCAEVGISRSTFYDLPDDQKPPMVKLGGSRLILEAPSAYLARHREGQAA